MRTSQAGEGEHADLLENVRPVTWRSIGHEGCVQSHTHLVQAAAHDLELSDPETTSR